MSPFLSLSSARKRCEGASVVLGSGEEVSAGKVVKGVGISFAIRRNF